MPRTKNGNSTKSLENKDNEEARKKLYALVQWVGGDDDGKYSTDIPVEFIKQFDYEEFQRNLENSVDDDDFSYVVEWRDKRKQPKGGWKAYNCVLKKVSCKQFYFLIIRSDKNGKRTCATCAT